MSTPNGNIFAGRLSSLRGSRTKADFARFLGIAPPVYQRYEDGRIPTHDNLLVIATRCDVTVDWLLGRTETSGRNDPGRSPKVSSRETAPPPLPESPSGIPPPGKAVAIGEGKILWNVAPGKVARKHGRLTIDMLPSWPVEAILELAHAMIDTEQYDQAITYITELKRRQEHDHASGHSPRGSPPESQNPPS